MSIWFVVPTNRLTAFRAAYLGQRIRGSGDPDQDEKAGNGVKNIDDSKRFFGSSRVTPVQANSLRAAHTPWLEIHTTPDFMATWEYPL